MIDDDAMRTKMSIAGQERMQNDFSIATMADKHITLYESIING